MTLLVGLCVRIPRQQESRVPQLEFVYLEDAIVVHDSLPAAAGIFSRSRKINVCLSVAALGVEATHGMPFGHVGRPSRYRRT